MRFYWMSRNDCVSYTLCVAHDFKAFQTVSTFIFGKTGFCYYSQPLSRKVFSSAFCLKIRGSSAPNTTKGSICVHFVAMNSRAVNSNRLFVLLFQSRIDIGTAPFCRCCDSVRDYSRQTPEKLWILYRFLQKIHIFFVFINKKSQRIS